ncbi:MAG: Ig-like domain-containing protein [Oleispira sp.]
MELFKKILVLTLSISSLAGCQLTDDEKKKLDKANVNLEKVAIAPLITFPAANDKVENSVDVRVDIDESVTYKSVSLLVDGENIATDLEPPYSFSWDPYFWSDRDQATLMIRAVTAEDVLLRSEVLTVRIGSFIQNQIQITQPTANQEFQNIDSTNIEWTAKSGATRYDYRIDSTSASTTVTSAAISLPAIGDYLLSVRATDAQGHTGQWSDGQAVSLVVPNSPTVQVAEAIGIDSGWQVNFSWSGGLVSTELQIAADISFNSLLDTYTLDTNTHSESLVTGVYYARARTTNTFDQVSGWSEVQTLTLGLFAGKINMATRLYDRPIDFVINDRDLVIVANASDWGDATSDFYVTKADLQGNKTWGRAFDNLLGSPNAISKTSTGYVLAGKGKAWQDAGILAVSENGSFQWSKEYQHTEDSIGYNQEAISNIVEVAVDQYVALQTTGNCTYTGDEVNGWARRPSTCPSENVEYRVKHIEKLGDTFTETDNIMVQPGSGKYDNFSQLLLTDSGLYAAGLYSASNDSSSDTFTPSVGASGAVLLKLNKVDGSILSYRTTGGVKALLNSITETLAGNIAVGYNGYYSAVSSILNTDNSVSNVIDGTMRNAQVVADPVNGGFIMLAQHRYNDYYYLTRYDEYNNQVGSSLPLNQCFRDLRPKKIKSHPKHGIVILGTDKQGSGSYLAHTVFFNVSSGFKYVCPE